MPESAFVPARKFYDIIERLDPERDPSGGDAMQLRRWRDGGQRGLIYSSYPP